MRLCKAWQLTGKLLLLSTRCACADSDPQTAAGKNLCNLDPSVRHIVRY